MTKTTPATFTQTVRVQEYSEGYLYFCPCNGGAPLDVEYYAESGADYRARVDAFNELQEGRPHFENSYYAGYPQQEQNDASHCPLCGAEPTVTMSLFGRGTFAQEDRYEYAKFYDNGNLLSLSFGVGTYTYNPAVRKIGYRNTRYRVTFNATTGNTYFLYRGKIRNVTYAIAEQHALSWMLNKIDKEVSVGVVDEFFRACAERRGVNHIDAARAAKAGFGDMAQILKFPVLENFPAYRLGGIPKEFRKPLASMKKVTEVFELFLGTSAKSIRKHLHSNEDIFFYRSLAASLSETSNIAKVLQAQKAFPLNASSTPLFMEGEFFEQVRESQNGIPFVIDTFCGGDETVFVNRLLTERIQHPDGGMVAVSPQRLIELLRDMKYMHTDLLRQIPDYDISYRGSFTQMHDRMSVEQSRLRFGNSLIRYSEEELQQYNRTVGPLEFRVAETTDRLRDIGRKMDICVGSYASRSAARHTTIVQAYHKDHYAVCIEVTNEGRLIQAKTPYNHQPNEELTACIKTWAEQVKVDASDCFDLQAPEDESLDSILRKPMDLEAIMDLQERADESPVYSQQPLAPFGAPFMQQAPQLPARVAEGPFPYGRHEVDNDNLPF